MTAKLESPLFIPKAIKGFHLTPRAARKSLWLLALAAVIAFAAWANTTLTAASSPTVATAMVPGLKLAVGTLNLEGTDQAVDSAAAAKLLPLWELLEQLDTSGSAAPQEVTAVVDEIQLNMTSVQIQAINAMKIDQSQVLGSTSAASAKSSSTKTSTQAASAAVDPALGGDMAGGAPMDGGGPMSGSSQTSTSSSKASTTGSAPAVIKQVIQLLQNKIQK